jgi:hypothetical protein
MTRRHFGHSCLWALVVIRIWSLRLPSVPLYAPKPAAPSPPSGGRLSREILDRIERVFDYHHVQQTHLRLRPGPGAKQIHRLVDNKPSPYRTFDDFPKVPLPRHPRRARRDARAPGRRLARMPASQLHAAADAQDAGTGCTWRRDHHREGRDGSRRYSLRCCPSSGRAVPVRDLCRRLRGGGPDAGPLPLQPARVLLASPPRRARRPHRTSKRGRPDWSTSRPSRRAAGLDQLLASAWRYKPAAYRYALLDAGHLVQNLVASAAPSDPDHGPAADERPARPRELIGVAEDAEFGEREAVQAMVVWADTATVPSRSPPAACATAS